MMSTEKSVSAFPENENFFRWIGTITGKWNEKLSFSSLNFRLFWFRTNRHRIWRPEIQTSSWVPQLVSLLTAISALSHKMFPSKHRLDRSTLSWHSQREMVGALWCTHYSTFNSVSSWRAEQRKSTEFTGRFDVVWSRSLQETSGCVLWEKQVGGMRIGDIVLAKMWIFGVREDEEAVKVFKATLIYYLISFPSFFLSFAQNHPPDYLIFLLKFLNLKTKFSLLTKVHVKSEANHSRIPQTKLFAWFF